MASMNPYLPLNISRGIRTSARRVPSKVAIEAAERHITYGELVKRMNQVGHTCVNGFGLSAGDRVVLLAPNCPEYIEIVTGLSDQGLIVVTLNPRMTSSELKTILEDCTPKLVIFHPDCENLRETCRNMGLADLVLGQSYEAFLSKASDQAPTVNVPDDQTFAISYTSGTTGAPKGVELPHRSRTLLAAASATEYNCFGFDDRFLSMSPLFHGAGFAFALASLSFGGTCVLYGNNDPEAIARRLGQGDITGVFMVPTHFKRLYDISEKSFKGFIAGNALKTIISNAAALAQTFKEQTVERFGAGLLHETYGSTEAGIVTNIRPSHLLEKPGSVGTPFIHMDIEIRKEDGSLCHPGEVGELFAKGPYTFNGYLNRKTETKQTLQNGWVTVQDLATQDEDGYITIIGRKKDMIVSGGVNIYPSEIEAVLSEQTGVAEVAVVGLPDPEWGERLHAFVVHKKSQILNEENLISACRASLAPHKIPRGITRIDALPRNPSGKILKRLLREQGSSF